MCIYDTYGIYIYVSMYISHVYMIVYTGWLILPSSVVHLCQQKQRLHRKLVDTVISENVGPNFRAGDVLL